MNNDKIKAILDYGFSVEAFVRQVTAGFSITGIPGELIAAIGLLKGAPVTVAEAPQALAQWLALSDADAVDIENYVVSHYGASPDSVDQAIEKVLNFVVSLHSIAQTVENWIKPAPAPTAKA